MTAEKIKEAWEKARLSGLHGHRVPFGGEQHVAAFYRNITAEERARCAKIARDYADDSRMYVFRSAFETAKLIENAIRNSEQEKVKQK